MQTKLQKREDTGWIDSVLLNGWVTYGADFQNVQFRKINGIVYIRGLCKNGGNDLIFNLPTGFRPKKAIILNASSSMNLVTLCRIDVSEDGNVYARYPYENDWFSFGYLSFMVD